jgi:hypothetical protein
MQCGIYLEDEGIVPDFMFGALIVLEDVADCGASS